MDILTITKDNFDAEVKRSDKPVLLDFWASWCSPCRTMGVVVEDVAGEVTTAKIGKVNVDEEPELAQAFGVMSIPTLVFLKDGKVQTSSVGVKPKRAIIDMLNL